MAFSSEPLCKTEPPSLWGEAPFYLSAPRMHLGADSGPHGNRSNLCQLECSLLLPLQEGDPHVLLRAGTPGDDKERTMAGSSPQHSPGRALSWPGWTDVQQCQASLHAPGSMPQGLLGTTASPPATSLEDLLSLIESTGKTDLFLKFHLAG